MATGTRDVIDVTSLWRKFAYNVNSVSADKLTDHSVNYLRNKPTINGLYAARIHCI